MDKDERRVYAAAYYRANKERWLDYGRASRARNPEAHRARYRAWYYKKRAEQRAPLGPESCAICGETERRLYMDHDHARYQVTSRSGWGSKVKYRGLLCNRCNTALSLVEDQGLLAKAIAYLEARS